MYIIKTNPAMQIFFLEFSKINYDFESAVSCRIRPSGMNDTDAATLVTVNLFVRSFSKIDDVKMVSKVPPDFQ